MIAGNAQSLRVGKSDGLEMKMVFHLFIVYDNLSESSVMDSILYLI